MLKKKAVWITCVALLCVIMPGRAADVRITEFMAINDTTLTNITGESSSTPDWIELRNTGSAAAALGGMRLTDDVLDQNKWRFPDYTLAPGEHLLVFASGDDERIPGQPFHTNFKLAGEGEVLGLIDADGEVIQLIPYPPQLPDISYGFSGGNVGDPGYFTNPTPSAPNDQPAVALPPILTKTLDRPGPVQVGPVLVVTTRVTQTSAPLQNVRLYYRHQFGAEFSVAMTHQGDGIYRGLLPTAGRNAGEMVRWRVRARDVNGRERWDPPFPDPLDSDQYFGTVFQDPGTNTSDLTVIHLFVEDTEAMHTEEGTRGAVYYLGRFYDNLKMDIHGQSSRSFPKKSTDVDFNKGNRFKWREGEKKVKDINLLTNWADKSKVRNTVAWEMFRDAGAPSHYAFPVRVELNSDFHGIWDMVEDGDDDWLDRIGFDGDGALYKIYDNLTRWELDPNDPRRSPEKKTRKDEGNSDLRTLINSLSILNNLVYAYDNLDIPTTINVLAGLAVTSAHDQGHKNFYVYRDTEGTGEWALMPWDIDLSLGHKWDGFNGGYFYDAMVNNEPINLGVPNRLKDLFFNDPVFRQCLNRRVRTLMDDLLQPPGTPAGQLKLEARIAELADLMDPSGVYSDAERDYDEWGSWGDEKNMRDSMDRLTDDHLVGRRQFLYNLSEVPAEQSASLGVTIGTIEFSPASGNQREEYITIVNPHDVALDISGWVVTGAVRHVFTGGTVLPPANSGRNRLYLAKDSVAFRARTTGPRGGQERLVQDGYDGQLSARGETVEILRPDGSLAATRTYAGDPSPAQAFLRISEIHYHPADASAPETALLSDVRGDDFEFVELWNTGPNAVDLSGVSFTEGIFFTFPNGTSLAPDTGLVIAKRPAAFVLRAPGLSAFGPYEGNLDNGGESIQLQDAVGETIIDIRYDDLWFPVTDGMGPSIEIQDVTVSLDAFETADGWRSSGAPGGTPGQLYTPLRLVSLPIQSVEEGVEVDTVLAVENDPLGRPVTFQLVSGVPGGMTVNPATGAITWTPNESQGGRSFTVTVAALDDLDSARFATASLTFSVAEINRPPVSDTASPQAAVEQQPFVLDLSASDPDLPVQSLTYSLLAAPAAMTLDGRTLRWTPTESDGPGSRVIRFAVSDGVAQTEALFLLTIAEGNRPPVPTVPSPQAAVEQQPFTINLSGTDPDVPTQPLSFRLIDAPTGMTLSGSTIQWTPTEAQGPANLTIRFAVSDGVTETEAAFSIAVAEVNRPPNLPTVSPLVLPEEQPWRLSLTPTDPDVPAQPLSLRVLSRPPGVVLDGMTLRWTPMESQGPGEFQVVVEVTDGQASTTRTIDLSVLEVNGTPSFATPSISDTTTEGHRWLFQAQASDPDSAADEIRYEFDAALGSLPVGLALSAETGWLRWIPGETHGGMTHTFRIVATDPQGASTIQTISVHVAERVEPPPTGCFVPDRVFPLGSTWHWSTTAFEDAWREPWATPPAATGSAPFGYGENGLATAIPEPPVGQLRTVFVRDFVVSDAAAVIGLTLRLRRDDGAVVYLNGVEVTRDNLPDGPLTSATRALNNVFGTSERTAFDLPLPVTALAEGDNTLAVAVHQVNPNSTDMVFDAAITLQRIAPCILIESDAFTATGEIRFSSIAGHSYEIQACDDLGNGVWVPLATIQADSATTTFIDVQESAPFPQRHYRVRALGILP